MRLANSNPLWYVSITWLLLGLSGTAHAQASTRIPVTVVMVDSLATDEGLSVIYRHYGPLKRDVIILDGRRANGRMLASAVFHLLVAREVAPDSMNRSARFRMDNVVVPTGWQSGERLRAAHMVNRLRIARKREIQGLGLVRAIELRIRSDKLRGRTLGNFHANR